MSENTRTLTSIIIACRNGVNYLAEAVAGIGRQQMPVEIIVIDDGSTDDTAALAKALGCAVFSIPHAGLSAARNLGLQKAGGEFVLFHDHDDVLRDSALPHLHAALAENTTCQIVQGKAQDFISPELDAALRQGPVPRPHPYYGLLSGAALFRREVFSALKPFDEQAATSPSLDLFLHAEEMGLPMTKIDCVTVNRRLHANNMGRHMRQREYQDLAAILRRKLQRG